MEIRSAIFTNQGDREYNEDCAIEITAPDGKCCFVVADGLGGHGRGEDASKSVCNSAKEYFEKNSHEISIEALFDICQKNLLQLQKEENVVDGMKTTMNVTIVDENNVYWGHVGDTRTYYFHKCKMRLRTKDHSVPQMMVNMGEMKETEIRFSPDRNRLLKVMGITWDKPQYSLEIPIKVSKKQVFLMCSDGFWELIIEKDMERLLRKSKTPKEWLESMADIVKENGVECNMDNYTALAVWIG